MAAQVMALPASTAAGTVRRPADSADPPLTDVATVDVVVVGGRSDTVDEASSMNNGVLVCMRHMNKVTGMLTGETRHYTSSTVHIIEFVDRRLGPETQCDGMS